MVANHTHGTTIIVGRHCRRFRCCGGGEGLTDGQCGARGTRRRRIVQRLVLVRHAIGRNGIQSTRDSSRKMIARRLQKFQEWAIHLQIAVDGHGIGTGKVVNRHDIIFWTMTKLGWNINIQ